MPQKLRSPADLRAFYRLMQSEDVTHEAILDSHRKVTLERIKERKTSQHDSTEGQPATDVTTGADGGL